MDRDEATLLLAMLMSRADGQVSASETEALAQAVVGRLHTSATRLDGLARRTLQDAHRHGPTAAMELLLPGLPTQEDRVAAFELALLVAVADGHVASTEKARLLDLADLLGLSEGDFTRVVRAVL